MNKLMRLQESLRLARIEYERLKRIERKHEKVYRNANAATEKAWMVWIGMRNRVQAEAIKC